MSYDGRININDTVVGACPFNFDQHDTTMSLSQMITTSKLNSFMCGGLNRTGPLCSKYQRGMGPVVLSCKWQCVECFDKRYVSYSYLVSSNHFMFVSDAFSASRDLC